MTTNNQLVTYCVCSGKRKGSDSDSDTELDLEDIVGADGVGDFVGHRAGMDVSAVLAGQVCGCRNAFYFEIPKKKNMSVVFMSGSNS